MSSVSYTSPSQTYGPDHHDPVAGSAGPVRWDLVNRVKRHIESGAYDHPAIIEHKIDSCLCSLLDDLREAG